MSGINLLNDGDTGLQARTIINSLVNAINNGTAGTSGTSGTSVNITQITSVVLNYGDWTFANGFYEYTYTNPIITSSDIAEVILDNGSYVIAANAIILPRVESSTGSLKLFSINSPSDNITVTINIIN